MIVCVHLPRFELVVAAGGAQALAGKPLALAPSAGGELRVGEVSGAAEAAGVRRGMALGQALASCPELQLVAADPLGVSEQWERAVRALEGVGAAVESQRVGLAYFQADGLRGVHGGQLGVIGAARAALGRPARVGAGPTRFCALAAALAVRSRRAEVVSQAEAASYLAAQRIGLLGFRAETAGLVEPLRRLGVGTLGELTALGVDALADRFGEPGVLAYRLACGEDTPLRARRAEDPLTESLELGESGCGVMLERVLGVLVDRLLARPERRGRTLRAVLLSARLVEGGTWRERVVFRQALADAGRMRLALSLRVGLLPAPAEALQLSVARFGPPGGDQCGLLQRGREVRMRRVHEAVGQMRAVAGPDAALRALCVDPDSRVPERRIVLTPFQA
jgi:protein ImuB